MPNEQLPQGMGFLKLREPVEEAVTFYVAEKEVLKFSADGKIYVQGRLVEKDIEVVHAFRKFLAGMGVASPQWLPEDYGEEPPRSRFERIDSD